MAAALRRLRANMLADTATMTRAQETAVAAQLLTHPAAKADPLTAAAIATEHGFTASFQPPAPGLGEALARHLKG